MLQLAIHLPCLCYGFSFLFELVVINEIGSICPMMLGSGGWSALRAPVYGLGFSDGETLVRGSASDWSVTRLFKELEGSPGRIFSKKACWRRVFEQELGGESEREAKDRFLQRDDSKLAEKSEKCLTFWSSGGPDGKLKDEAKFCRDGVNSVDRNFFVDRKGEDKVPVGTDFSCQTVTSPAHGHDERLQYRKDDPKSAQPSVMSSSPEERPWPSDSGILYPSAGGNAGEGARERSRGEAPSGGLSQESREGKGDSATNNGEDWRSLSRALTARQKFCTISNHDLMKIAELRFSSDMEDGDSGGQVSLLQRALFWLGYLPKQSYITGYFGTETKKALCEFQEAHGVHSTGRWGSLSKQALWHNISGEILHRVADEKAVHRSKPPDAPHSHAFTSLGARMQLWQSIQPWNPMNFGGAISRAIPEGDWKLLSGIALLVGGALFGIIKLKSSSKGMPQEHSVKRRIIRSRRYEDSALPSQADMYSNGSSELKKRHTIEKDGVTKISQLPHAKPPPSSQYESASQLGSSHRHDGQAFGGDLSSDLEIEKEVQRSKGGSIAHFRSGKKATSALSVSSKEGISSKPGTETVKKDRRLASQGRQAGLGPALVTSKGDRHEALPLSESGSPKFQAGKHDPSTGLNSAEKSPFQRVVLGDTSNTSGRNSAERPFKKIEGEHTIQKPERISEVTRAENNWQEEDELNLKRRMEDLHQAVHAAEQNRLAAMRALAEERQRSLELEVKICKQRDAAARLEDEVRVLKESHDALLASLRKKYSSSAAARAAAALLYQNWDSDGDNSGEVGF